jgi:hypothetical protein
MGKIMKSTLSHRISGALAFACVIALAGCSGEHAADDPAADLAAISMAVTSPDVANADLGSAKLASTDPVSAELVSTPLSAVTNEVNNISKHLSKVKNESEDMATICASMSEEVFFTLDKLVPRMINENSVLLLRFVQLTDGRIIDGNGNGNGDDDDDGPVTASTMNGASALAARPVPLESAQRLPHDYSDDVLGDLILSLNECNRLFPSWFSIVASDSPDLTAPT